MIEAAKWKAAKGAGVVGKRKILLVQLRSREAVGSSSSSSRGRGRGSGLYFSVPCLFCHSFPVVNKWNNTYAKYHSITLFRTCHSLHPLHSDNIVFP
jgi:hypothetical protein